MAGHNKETKFTISKDANELILELKIPKNHIIYWIQPGLTGLPTKVELKRSSNLNNYKLICQFLPTNQIIIWLV